MTKLEEYLNRIVELVEEYSEFRTFFYIVESDSTVHFASSEELCKVCVAENLVEIIKNKKIKHLTDYLLN